MMIEIAFELTALLHKHVYVESM